MSTNVYALFDGAYEDRYLVGVYATLEAAQAAHTGHDPEWRHEDGSWWFCDWSQGRVEGVLADMTFETRTVPVIDGVATLHDGRTVESTSAFVSYPIPPNPLLWAVEPVAGASCSLMIEEHALAGAA